MIELKDFQNLLQVQSLEIMIDKHQASILDEESRITKIEKSIASSHEQTIEDKENLSRINTEIEQKENQLDQVETNLKRTEQNASSVTSSQQAAAIEKELEHLRRQKDEIEEETLALLSLSEELENGISDQTNFQVGSKESLIEIKNEVADNIQHENDEIASLKMRIKNLFEISSSESVEAYLGASKLFQGKYPLAHIIDSKCNRCYSIVPRNLESQINRGGTVDYCPGCGRLLAPNI